MIKLKLTTYGGSFLNRMRGEMRANMKGGCDFRDRHHEFDDTNGVKTLISTTIYECNCGETMEVDTNHYYNNMNLQICVQKGIFEMVS